MQKSNKIKGQTTLYAVIREDQYDAIKLISSVTKKSIAEITRDALDIYIDRERPKYVEKIKELQQIFHVL
jgi:hypothetical protein